MNNLISRPCTIQSHFEFLFFVCLLIVNIKSRINVAFKSNKLFAIILFAPILAWGQTGWSGFRAITDFGCHNIDSTCFLTVDGPPVSGGSGCTSNSIRWDSKNDPNGKTWLAIILAAKASGGRVGFNINRCYPAQINYPTFNWGLLE
jgi:hypothetical protein